MILRWGLRVIDRACRVLQPQKERDQNLKQAWGLLNTYFVSTNGFLVILILGLLGLYTSVHEAMLYSALDMITKMIYGGEFGTPCSRCHAAQTAKLSSADAPRGIHCRRRRLQLCRPYSCIGGSNCLLGVCQLISNCLAPCAVYVVTVILVRR